jgi:hypothetical protein
MMKRNAVVVSPQRRRVEEASAARGASGCDLRNFKRRATPCEPSVHAAANSAIALS